MKKTPQDFNKEGLIACDQKDFNKALLLFNKALSINPAYIPGLYQRAKVFYQLGNYQEALKDFNKLLELAPENATYFSERALIKNALKDSKGTIEDLDKAVILEPEKSYRYASRAFIKDRLGDLTGALKDYEMALQLDPTDAISHNNKGLVEEKLGRHSQALKSFSSADSLDPKYKGGKNHISDKIDQQDMHEMSAGADCVSESKANKLSFFDYFRQVRLLITSSQQRRDFKKYLIGLFGKHS